MEYEVTGAGRHNKSCLPNAGIIERMLLQKKPVLIVVICFIA